MKKIILICISFLFILAGCSQGETFINRDIHNSNLVKTASSYLKTSDGGSVFEVDSQFSESSAIKNNSTYRFLKKKSKNYSIQKCNEKRNKFYCDLIVMQINGEGTLNSKQISKIDSFFDLYFLYETANSIKEVSMIQDIKEHIHQMRKPVQGDQIEYLYFTLLSLELDSNISTSPAKETIKTIIDEYSSQDLMDPNRPILLYAALKLNDSHKWGIKLERLQSLYQNEQNQITLLFCDEITYWIQLQIVEMVMENDAGKKAFVNLLNQNKPYTSFYHSLDSIRNLYLMSNLFASNKLKHTEQYIEVINSRLDTLLGSEKKTQQNLYFISVIDQILKNENRDLSEFPDVNCNDLNNLSERYYCGKNQDENDLFNEKKLLEENKLLTKLLIYDSVTLTSSQKKEVKSLFPTVLKYDGKDDYVVLNVYSSMITEHELKVDTEKIKERIKEKECGLGYCEKAGNYSFEMSVYLNNILNILEGDEIARRFR